MGGVLSQPKHVSNHHVAHLKCLYLAIIFVSYILIKLEKMEKPKTLTKNVWVYFLTLHSGPLIDLSDFLAKL